MRYLRLVLLLLMVASGACSSSNDDQERPETNSERIGREAAQQISATLQSAEKARALQEQHANQVEEDVRNQAGSGN